MNEPTRPIIEELERRDFKTDMLYIMVSIPLVVVGVTCIVLFAVLQQRWLGLVGVVLWTAAWVTTVVWFEIKKNIYGKILQAEEESLKQMVKERENSK